MPLELYHVEVDVKVRGADPVRAHPERGLRPRIESSARGFQFLVEAAGVPPRHFDRDHVSPVWVELQIDRLEDSHNILASFIGYGERAERHFEMAGMFIEMAEFSRARSQASRAHEMMHETSGAEFEGLMERARQISARME